MVHKDLKPANLMISTRGLIILDLGIAAITELVDGKEQILTSTLHRKGGTFQYKAPEMFERMHLKQQEQVTNKTDV